MKTILVATDLTIAAENAARYALQLAKKIKAGVTLCHAFQVPAEALGAAQAAWPLEDYPTVKAEVTEELRSLADKLMEEDRADALSDTFHPQVRFESEVGIVTDVARNFFDEQKCSLLVMGTSGAGGLTRFFLGSNSKKMIDKANFPVLLIPVEAAFNGIEKISFATDLHSSDIDIILSLAGMAYFLNAEILITHITHEKYIEDGHQDRVDAFLSEISSRVNYPKIYYRRVKSISVETGLNWMSEHGQVDMLAVVHRPHDAFDKIFKGSHTQKLVHNIGIPLLVFPEGYHAVI